MKNIKKLCIEEGNHSCQWKIKQASSKIKNGKQLFGDLLAGKKISPAIGDNYLITSLN
jgi:hypothetical protein